MSIELKITFGGLCLFVPEPPLQMHVLMPATGKDHHGHGVERHFTLLIYDKAHAEQRAKSLTRVPEFFNLRGCALTLSVAPSSRPQMALPDEVVDLKSADEREVDRRLLAGKPNGSLASRITLHSGEYTDKGEGAIWRLFKKDRELSPWLEWTISDLNTDSLRWNMDGSGQAPPPLYPLEGKRSIQLFAYNIPALEIPAEVPPGEPGPSVPDGAHFDAYYDLLTPQPPREPPEYKRPPKGKALLGISPFRCMTAQSTVMP